MKTSSIPWLLLLTLAACKKEQSELDKLPQPTQTGANTAGCLINGKAFVATGWGSGMGKVAGIAGGFYTDTIYWLRLNGVYQDQHTTLSIFLRNAHKTGRYELVYSTPIVPIAGLLQARSHATCSFVDGNETFATTTQATGYVQLNVATVPNSSAGTFEFTAASLTDPSNTITVTHGRFDTRY